VNAPAKQDKDIEIQRAFYAKGEHALDPAHEIHASHDFALALLLGFLGSIEVKSLLDVGAGTGRTMAKIHEAHPHIELKGVEIVPELRQMSVERWGLAPGQIADGDATKLAFPDKSVDFVIAFGILHHIKDHARAVSELVRVARKGVMISDVNCYGQGSRPVRRVKQLMRALRVWDLGTFIRTRGKGYFVSDGDGLFYSYSLIDDIPILNERFRNVILANATGKSIDHYRDAPYVVAIASDEHL
jgi:SAM-dependent methyltransferase